VCADGEDGQPVTLSKLQVIDVSVGKLRRGRSLEEAVVGEELGLVGLTPERSIPVLRDWNRWAEKREWSGQLDRRREISLRR
jgi:hypothetical protein